MSGRRLHRPAAAVFLAYDELDGLLYVGHAANVASRLRSAASAPWWRQVARVQLIPFQSATAAKLRKLQILRDRPGRYNTAGVPSWHQRQADLRAAHLRAALARAAP